MRARYPDTDGYALRDGVKLFYEVFGEGEPTVLLLPTWSIVHSRHWKMQVPYLAQPFRVVTFDGRGNGRSDRPTAAEAYSVDEFVADALAVMDATDTDRAVIVGFSLGGQRVLQLAALHPERVIAAAFIAPAVPMGEILPEREVVAPFEEELDTDEDCSLYRPDSRRHLHFAYVTFFSARVCT